ncbi:MAG: hypothetical protein U5L11_00750 [Arhodomonas sp.]|nr:hypothetical protein [Arhodomonas sp.]
MTGNNLGTGVDLTTQDPANAQTAVTAGGFLALSAAADADHAVANVQASINNTSETTATLQVYNQELGSAGDIGISDSTVAMSGNSVRATSRANRADSALTLDAGSTLGATGAVVNAQSNVLGFTTVEAEASGEFTLQMDGDGVATADGSDVNVDGNAVGATAESNRASNALTVETGAGYANLADDGATATIVDADPAAEAPYALQSAQLTRDNVTAGVEGGVLIDLDGDAASVVDASSITASDNTFDATATANAVGNTVTERADAGGNGGFALSNSQLNVGSVSASNLDDAGEGTFVDLQFNGDPTATTDGIVSGSSLTAAGNVATVRSTGNEADNVIDAEIGPVSTDNLAGGASASDAWVTDGTYALTSGQQNQGSVSATAEGGVRVTADGSDGPVILGSGITLDGNAQQAVAVANNAANEVALSGTNSGGEDGLGLSSGLSSVQEQTDDLGGPYQIGAFSDTSVEAPARLGGSSLAITGNRSTATAIVNEAANTSNVGFTNADTAVDLGGNASPG